MAPHLLIHKISKVVGLVALVDAQQAQAHEQLRRGDAQHTAPRLQGEASRGKRREALIGLVGQLARCSAVPIAIWHDEIVGDRRRMRPTLTCTIRMGASLNLRSVQRARE